MTTDRHTEPRPIYMDDEPCCYGVPQRSCPWHRATSDAIGFPAADIYSELPAQEQRT